MGSEVRVKDLDGAASSVFYRVASWNLAAGLSGTGAAAIFVTPAATGFAAGYILGVLNMFWLLKIARRGVNLPPERAGGFVAKRYYMRFLVTALIITLLVSKGIFGPWPLMAGLTGSIFTTIIAITRIAREEAS